MKSGFTAATALAIAIAATTASAGVVISQQVSFNQAGERKTDQTVMVQGHKQKIIAGDRESITDLDAGKTYILAAKSKTFIEIPFPPTGMFAMAMVVQGSTVELKKSGGTHQVAGYACQDYTGAALIGRSNLDVTQCVARDVPGTREFVEFQKAMADKLKGKPLARKGEIPDGIPVSSTVTRTVAPFTPPPGFSPERAAKIKAMMAKYKPVTINTTVSKIEVKDLPADTFVVPAIYRKPEMPTAPQLKQLPQFKKSAPGIVTPGPAPAAGAPAALAAPAAPAAPGAH